MDRRKKKREREGGGHDHPKLLQWSSQDPHLSVPFSQTNQLLEGEREAIEARLSYEEERRR